MRRLWLALVLALLPSAALAQSTAVTLQVTDAASQVWSNGTWSATLVPPPGNITQSQLAVAGSPVPNPNQSGTLSATGGATMTLTPNAAIAPTPSTWVFSVCPLATTSCFLSSQTIVGASQTVTLTPPQPSVTPGPFAQAYTDAEILNPVIGSTYYNTITNQPRVCNGPAPCTWLATAASVNGPASGSFSGAPLLGSAPAMGPVINCTGCSASDTIGWIMWDSVVAATTNPIAEVVMKNNGQVESINLNHLGYTNLQVGSAGTGDLTSYNSLQIDTANNADILLRPGAGPTGSNTGNIHLGATSGGGVFQTNLAAEGTGASVSGSGGACASLNLPVPVGYIYAAICNTAATGATTLTITPPAGTPTPANALWCEGWDVGTVSGGGGQGTRGVQSAYSNITCKVIFPTGVIQNDIIILRWGWF